MKPENIQIDYSFLKAHKTPALAIKVNSLIPACGISANFNVFEELAKAKLIPHEANAKIVASSIPLLAFVISARSSFAEFWLIQLPLSGETAAGLK